MTKVYTCYQSKNDELVRNVAELYLFEGAKIADVTFGKGAFWKKLDMGKYDFYGSDLKADDGVAEYFGLRVAYNTDFKNLPYESDSFDVVVLDPPYVHNPGKMFVDATYNNAETTKGFYYDDIVTLYADGMKEAKRVLKPGGRLWVKCQDQIESGKQKWAHIDLFLTAVQLDFYAKDMFVLHQESKPHIQHQNQQHARRNHSYLWIFEKR